MEFFFAYITVPDVEEARRLGKTLVAERLPGMESHYWWNGKLESAQEAVLIAKTRDGLREALRARVRDLHPAETPCIVFLPLASGDPDYLGWIAAETQAP
jgi:periplasmic divalent cation tolerance protein